MSASIIPAADALMDSTLSPAIDATRSFSYPEAKLRHEFREEVKFERQPENENEKRKTEAIKK
jgi:hypothetical protein